MKIYIAGKITGQKNYKKLFKQAEQKLTEQGYIVMNPAILPEGFRHDQYMKICFAMIDCCDALYQLPNWEDSEGARLETHYAGVVGKKIIS